MDDDTEGGIWDRVFRYATHISRELLAHVLFILLAASETVRDTLS